MAQQAVIDEGNPPELDPLKKIDDALGYGASLWKKIKICSALDQPQLLYLTLLLEAHTEALFELYMLTDLFHTIPCDIIKRLKGFYSTSDQAVKCTKRGQPLHAVISSTNASALTICEENYYEVLTNSIPDDEDDLYYQSNNMTIVINPQEKKKPSPKQQEPAIAATFPEDLGISAVSSFMIRQRQDVDMEEIQQEGTQCEVQSPPAVTTIVAQQVPSHRLRLNLIRHKNATPTDLTTLQLFKAFAISAKKTDKNIIFLPIDSTKQNLSPLISKTQIDNLTPNQMRLYFSSFYKDQHHSISGFIHIVTTLPEEALESTLPLAEWLQTYQYSIVKCKSQEEEMSIVGALCYGSLFLHRDGLLQGIMSHPDWAILNKDQTKPIIIDLVVKSFKSPGKSADMIFVRAERSKKTLVQQFFLSLYDGAPKKYPRGDMLFFIPVTSNLENDYTNEQRAKYLFNHLTFLGDEDCMAVYGLACLSNEVTLIDGSTITVRTLLKSLPASPGMTRNRLFQVVDINPSHDSVIVTYQRSDRSFVEDRKFTLEQEILSHLAPGNTGDENSPFYTVFPQSGTV
jgi:hypothetical protein